MRKILQLIDLTHPNKKKIHMQLLLAHQCVSLKKVIALMGVLFVLILFGCNHQEKASKWKVIQLESENQPDIVSAISFSTRNKGLLTATNRGETSIFSSNSGDDWIQINNIEFHLYDMEHINNELAVAVANGGAILLTKDHGKTWIEAESGTIQPLMAIAFSDSLTGIAIGRDGVIIKTADGAATWEIIETNSASFLRDVSYIGNERWVAVGFSGTILYSDDNGLNWKEAVTETGRNLFSVAFLNERIGFAVGSEGIVLKSQNGGINWREQENLGSRGLLDVRFYDDETGYISGFGGRLFSTTDGGASWVLQNTGTDLGLRTIYFRDRDFVVIGSELGSILVKD